MNGKAILRRPFAEVQRDYEAAMVSLDTAKSQDDDSRVMFYKLDVRNLFKELQSMDEGFLIIFWMPYFHIPAVYFL